MNSSSSPRSIGKRSKVGGIAVVLLVALYSLLAPYINDRFDLELPTIRTDAAGNVRVVDADQEAPAAVAVADGSAESTAKAARKAAPVPNVGTAEPGHQPSGKAERAKPAADTEDQSEPNSRKGRGPLADRVRSSSRSESQSVATAKRSKPAEVDDGLYGMLREVSRDRYVSPAGLMYVPGSAEGHRLEHLRRHTKDDPRRPGKHGVFDGDMEGALKTIDRAYQRAKQGQRTTVKQDRGRTIYTVDLGSRIGYIGGRDGNLKRKPMARRVRLVLEGDRVITAYPL